MANTSSGGRRRCQRACEMCYRKKTKCELETSDSICMQCTRRGSRCVFPGISPVSETQQEEERDQYIQSLKDRLEKIETLLKTAGILHESDVTGDYLDDEIDAESPDDDQGNGHRRTRSLGNLSYRSSESNALSDYCEAAKYGGDLEGTPIFKAHESDDPRFFGRSCSLSILSRGGIEWIKNKTGDVSFLRLLSPDSVHDSPWSIWRPDVFHDLFASQVYRPLPPRSEVFSLMKDFFRTANRLFPIFHESTFMKMVEWQYTQQTCDDAARWASINMTICLAYEYRYSNSLKSEKDREKARMYFKNAMSVFTELALRRTDILSVQALLSMAFFLRGNSGTQSALPFITAAMRSCQRMGLHRDIPRPDLSIEDQEQRRRVFWVTFTVDQSTCLRAGNAPSQHPDDFDVPLPEELEEEKKDSEVASNIPFFRQLCRMALIKSRIFCRLYSAKALLKPPREIYQVVKELHAELEEWEKDYPFEEEPRQKVAETDFLFGFGSIGLRLVYYNALIMIHRIPLLLNYLISSREDPEELKSLSKAQASKSAVICVQAARDTLKLVNNMPWGDIAWLWSLLYYVFLAAATIFSNILRDTRHSSVREDLHSLNMAATFFATLVPGDGPANYAGFMTRMSANLERIARLAIEKDEKRARDPDDIDNGDQTPGAKRQHSRANSASQPKFRHRPTNLRTSMNSDTTGSYHYHTSEAPHASNPSATARSYMADFGIPESIEGLPPINSSGYVVPLSPSRIDFSVSTGISNQQQPESATGGYSGLGLSNMNNTTPDFNTIWIQPQQQSTTTNTATTLSSPQDQHQSPFSASSTNSTQIPESWQVPLTADWSYGDNLWSGLFPTEALVASGTVQDPGLPMPILSAESFLNADQANMSQSTGNPDITFGTDNMDYGFAPSTTQDQNPNQEGDLWPNGFLGLF
ncbi:hypothetical protein N7532_003784 [Penicillium argentinense]|uniref:Zn(2)-C6 fungal-type domain-containing protein n=1 Tax=Penicillium argentinense TaxID=1131581 RepID=A0A9W9FN43_9EURO|nr:uncharacterized protein N7532_003784 [Penicillium argentinense]KAJ5103255.1 hypothetical protein N7532_003784 [Penicillium argentinense]